MTLASDILTDLYRQASSPPLRQARCRALLSEMPSPPQVIKRRECLLFTRNRSDSMAVIVPASTRQKTVGIVMVAASLIYLTHFVGRGWLGHDEGMLAQAAERVLLGDVPHVSYEEPYTDTWIYAATFRVTGIELLHIRWLLFAVAAFAVALLYVLLRRFLKPAGAGLATWIGLAWSFPNYFAGLPSWWLLTWRVASTWAMVRLVESRELRYRSPRGSSRRNSDNH